MDLDLHIILKSILIPFWFPFFIVLRFLISASLLKAPYFPYFLPKMGCGNPSFLKTPTLLPRRLQHSFAISLFFMPNLLRSSSKMHSRTDESGIPSFIADFRSKAFNMSPLSAEKCKRKIYLQFHSFRGYQIWMLSFITALLFPPAAAL